MATPILALATKLNPENDAYRQFLDLVLSDICNKSGANYVGIQKQIVPHVPVLILFQSQKTRSTLSLPLAEVTEMRIAARVRESDLKFEKRPPRPRLVRQTPTLKLACLVHQSLAKNQQAEWNAIVENLRKIRPGSRRRTKRNQAGFIFLLEMLCVAAILLTMAAIAVPNLYRLSLDRQSGAAKDRVAMVGRVEASLAACTTMPGCTPSPAALALIPAPGTTTVIGNYTFVMSDGGVYTATPNIPALTIQYSVGPDGVVLCGGVACL